MKKKVLIIGGGFAGINSAVFLADRGFEVTLVEKSSVLGGRAKTLTDKKNNVDYDNSQHLLLGCYKHTLALIKKIGSFEKLNIQKNLNICFTDSKNQKYFLKERISLYPFSLLTTFLYFDYLELGERIKNIKMLTLLSLGLFKTNESTEIFLNKCKLSDNSINGFWKLFLKSIFNCDLNEIPTDDFKFVIQKIFLRGKFASRLILPDSNMHELIFNPAKEFLLQKRTNIILNEEITGVELNDKSVIFISNKRRYKDYDYFISAMDFKSTKKLFSGFPDILQHELNFNSIIGCKLELNNYSFPEKIYGLMKSKIDWIFNHNSFINIVISNPCDLINFKKNEIFETILAELKIFFPDLKNDNIRNHHIVINKNATFINNIKTKKIRKKYDIRLQNVLFCGDYCNTGYPSTIEGAVLSSNNILKNIPGIKNG